MAQYSMRWCDICKQWVTCYNESAVVRCPYCENDLTFEKSPQEMNEYAREVARQVATQMGRTEN